MSASGASSSRPGSSRPTTSPARRPSPARPGEGEGVRGECRGAGVEEREPAVDAAELIVCCEVMEHLPDPDAALSVVASLASPWAIVSVPREPLWRALNIARLKYLGALG